MTRKLWLLLVVLTFVGAGWGSWLRGRSEVLLVGGLTVAEQAYLVRVGEEFALEGEDALLRPRSWRAYLPLYRFECRGVQLCEQNLANCQTFTADGSPYLRSFPRLTPEGEVREQKAADPPNLVYDPSHPAASEQGYVAMPNVNLVSERRALARHQDRARLWGKLIGDLHPACLLPAARELPVPSSLPAEADGQAFADFMATPKPAPSPEAKDEEEATLMGSTSDETAEAGTFVVPASSSMDGLGVAGPAARQGASVLPLAQQSACGAGQTAVAMCVNALTGRKLTDTDIDSRYGFDLLKALNDESRGAGYVWKDRGDLSASSWASIEVKLNRQHTPVLVALNGPLFSPDGRGHIVVLVGLKGDRVIFADPATGTLRAASRVEMEAAPAHPDGNFVFSADPTAAPDTF